MRGGGLAPSENRYHRLSGNDGELHELREAALDIGVRAILASLRSSIRVVSSDPDQDAFTVPLSRRSILLRPAHGGRHCPSAPAGSYVFGQCVVMLNGSRAVRISTINFSGTRFGRKGPQQSGFMHLAKLTTGRQGCPHLRRAGAIASPDWSSFLCIRPRTERQRRIDRREKVTLFVERRVPVTGRNWVEMILGSCSRRPSPTADLRWQKPVRS